MKIFKHITTALLLFIAISVTAQQGINYKAIVKDGSGNIVANDLIVVQFTILETSSAGTIVYKELHTPSTDANGFVIINIGEGTPLSGVYADIDWGGDIHFLKMEINTEGSFVDMGTTQFKTVPYALSSADNQWLITGNDIENRNTGKVTINGSLDVGTTVNLELGTTVNEISIDGTLADNSDDAIPTEKAVKTYVDNSSLNNTVTKIDDLTDGKSDTDGNSLFLGVNAGLNDDGTNNTNVGIGLNALATNADGEGNTANGFYALHLNTGSHNTANGSAALFFNTIGNNNTATGFQALFNNTEGSENTANGSYALLSNTTGYNNTANGYQALLSNTTGYTNTANGYQALYSNIDGNENTANGQQALWSNTTGDGNTANGNEALYSNIGGNGNTASGYQTLSSNVNGIWNTAYGTGALQNNTSGNENTAIGYGALRNNTTGSNNIAIGYEVGIGTSISNRVRIGNISVTEAIIEVAWTTSSDKRRKENIRELPYGLIFVKQLHPVDYLRKDNEHKTREMGFIAQDVEALLAKVGYTDQGFLHKDDKGFMSLRYNDFIALITKAIQEQQEIIEEQSKKLNGQESKIESQDKNYEKLLKRVEQLELVSNQ